jgi:hypothetical protein
MRLTSDHRVRQPPWGLVVNAQRTEGPLGSRGVSRSESDSSRLRKGVVPRNPADPRVRAKLR